jgi:hypothetical protein
MVENCIAGYNSCMFAYGQVNKYLFAPIPGLSYIFKFWHFFDLEYVVEFRSFLSWFSIFGFPIWQTGSGKTHTMLGDIADLDFQPSDNRGMTPRVFESLFAKIQVV